MKTLEDLKSALSTETYRKTFSYSPDMGTPEGIQKQFDAAVKFPTHVSYLDMGILEGVKTPVEIVTVLVDADGTIIERLTDKRTFVVKE